MGFDHLSKNKHIVDMDVVNDITCIHPSVITCDHIIFSLPVRMCRKTTPSLCVGFGSPKCWREHNVKSFTLKFLCDGQGAGRLEDIRTQLFKASLRGQFFNYFKT